MRTDRWKVWALLVSARHQRPPDGVTATTSSGRVMVGTWPAPRITTSLESGMAWDGRLRDRQRGLGLQGPRSRRGRPQQSWHVASTHQVVRDPVPDQDREL